MRMNCYYVKKDYKYLVNTIPFYPPRLVLFKDDPKNNFCYGFIHGPYEILCLCCNGITEIGDVSDLIVIENITNYLDATLKEHFASVEEILENAKKITPNK